jgi:hypothetical protein
MTLKDLLREMDRAAADARVAREAILRLHFSLVDDPTMSRGFDFDRGQVDGARRRLDPTYVVRVFATFEWGLRTIWADAFGRATQPAMAQLLDAAASAARFMPADVLEDAHRVREFRNTVVHVGDEPEEVFTVSDATGILKRYLSQMPRSW